MDAAHIPAFAEQFDDVAHARLCEADLVPELRIDLDVDIGSVGEELEKLVRHFEPFGIGNPAPVFRSLGAALATTPRRIGADGLRLAFDLPRGSIEGIGWGMADRANSLDVKRPVDIAYRLERDEYRGVSRLQLKLADVRG